MSHMLKVVGIKILPGIGEGSQNRGPGDRNTDSKILPILQTYIYCIFSYKKLQLSNHIHYTF